MFTIVYLNPKLVTASGSMGGYGGGYDSSKLRPIFMIQKNA